jgi:hypothetical protein
LGEETFYSYGEVLYLDLLARDEGALLNLLLLLLEVDHLCMLLGLLGLLGLLRLLLLEDILLVHHLSSVTASSQDFSKGDKQRKVFGPCQTLIWI